ncbi:MAG: hypothetical protein FWH34_06245 [Desulfovibrionaceae bacterium]|nr:hypothetical protein [Desulfovibrionaceae bacterium]MCL2123675.1 hypothetical protein [Desulfovibrionaceae bacterium]
MGRSKYAIGLPRRIASTMTKSDKKALAEWVADGNSPLDNPWLLCREDGWPFDFVSAMRFWRDVDEGMEACVDGDGADVPCATASGKIPF